MTDDRLIVADLSEIEVDSEVVQAGLPDADEYYASRSFRIVYQTNNFLLPQLKDLIEKGEVLNLRPEYQRRLRWGSPQKSRLIESLLLNIPIPPVFLFETDAARYEVMDGQQRLNAVKEYLAGDFALSGLEVLKPLNGLRYYRCPPRIKRALDRASLSAIVLLLESEPKFPDTALTSGEIRRFIFDRLNTGGTKLNAQELRNATNPGAFNQLLVELSRLREFTTVFGIPPYEEADPNDYYENELRQKNNLYATMADCQLILRFFALREDENIRGSMKKMLDRAMESRVDIDQDHANQLGVRFTELFKFLFEIFQGQPFQLAPDDKGRVRVSAAMYDASMVAMDVLWERRENIRANADAVRVRMSEALVDDDEVELLTGQANTAIAVKARIGLMQSILLSKV